MMLRRSPGTAALRSRASLPQYDLGLMYFNGWGVAQDDVEAGAWYRRRSRASPRRSTGLDTYSPEVPETVACRRTTRKLSGGTAWPRSRASPSAQFNLGKMYELGRGVTQDDAEAVRWYRLAAEQGHADAQYNLGNMYSDTIYTIFDRGVAVDEAEAVRWA